MLQANQLNFASGNGLAWRLQAGSSHQRDPHQGHTRDEAGRRNADSDDSDSNDGRNIDHAVDDDEDDGMDQASDPDDHMQDDLMDSNPDDDTDARDVSMDPPEQSGYPVNTDDEEEEYERSPSALGSTQEAEMPSHKQKGTDAANRLEAAEVISIDSDDDDDGVDSMNAQNVKPAGSSNVQVVRENTFLAAVKKQSKVKEGDWMQIRQQSGSGDYGVIDTG